MKKIMLIIIAAFGILGLTGCGNTQTSDSVSSDNRTSQSATQHTDSAEEVTDEDKSDTDNSDKTSIPETISETEEISDSTEKGTLVVYFSATGTTKGVAEGIASVTNADLYEIIPAEPYSSDDLDWHDNNSRTSIEMNDPDTRPEIASDTVSLDGYSTIYIGYPIWWGDAPRIMSTFVESYNFDNITVIPFCTSGSSGIGSSGDNLKDLANSGNWLSGDRLDANISESEIQDWINDLN